MAPVRPPAPSAYPPPPVYPPPVYPPPLYPANRRRGRGACSPLAAAIAILVVAALLLAGVGYGSWAWATHQPRLNVLILGLDRRPEQGNVVRSDVMMLMTVYPPGPRVGLLSIPRDLYVEIPGYGTNRINTAHFWGESEAEGRGPALAAQTVAQNFGVPVQRTVRLDFDAFRAVVDGVGGVDILVEEPIVDDAYPTEDYGTIRIEIPAGQQHMDGETALRYVRSRHGSSDFDRAARQQQVLVALGRRLLDPGVWPNLPAVYAAAARHVETDLTVGDMLVIGLTVYRVGPDAIERCVIDRDMTEPWTTPSGASVLLPRWELIRPVVQALFTP